MNTPLRDRFQQTAMKVHELGDIDRAITVGVQRRNRTVGITTAIAVAAVVILAAVIVSNPLKGATPEPLQPPTPTPTFGADVNGWPSTGHNAPGLYSLDNKMCGSMYRGGYCNVGWMHNGYGSGDVQIWMSVRPEDGGIADVDPGSSSLDDGTPVVVAGYDGIYRRIDARLEQWRLDVEGRTIVIDLKAKPGTSRADLVEAHTIIDSMRTAPTDNVLNDLGYKLVFTLTTNDWDSG